MGRRGPKAGSKPKKKRLHVYVKPGVKAAIMAAMNPTDSKLNTAGKIVDSCVEQCLPIPEKTS